MGRNDDEVNVVLEKDENMSNINITEKEKYCFAKKLESWKWKHKEYEIDTEIIRLSLDQEYSRKKDHFCVEDKTFGFKGSVLWVNGGCRGSFTVCTVRTETVEEKVDQLVKEMTNIKRSLKSVLAAQQAQITSQQTEISTQQNLTESQQSEINTQKEQITAQKSEINTQKNQITTQQSQINTQKDQIDTQQSQINIQKNQMSAQQSEINTMKNQISALEKNLTGTMQHTSAEIRLIGGDGWSKGAVQVYHEGKVGMLCDDYFNINSNGAQVVCKMFGFRTGFYEDGNDFTTMPDANYILDDVRCTGNELNINACVHREWGQHNCSHRELSGVRCA